MSTHIYIYTHIHKYLFFPLQTLANPFWTKITKPSIMANAAIPKIPLLTIAFPPPLKASMALVRPPAIIEFQGSSFFLTATNVQSQIENIQPHTANDPNYNTTQNNHTIYLKANRSQYKA